MASVDNVIGTIAGVVEDIAGEVVKDAPNVAKFLVPTEAELFAFLQCRYGQRADARQRERGLVYNEAETHDLAKEIHKFVKEHIETEWEGIEKILLSLL